MSSRILFLTLLIIGVCLFVRHAAAHSEPIQLMLQVRHVPRFPELTPLSPDLPFHLFLPELFNRVLSKLYIIYINISLTRKKGFCALNDQISRTPRISLQNSPPPFSFSFSLPFLGFSLLLLLF